MNRTAKVAKSATKKDSAQDTVITAQTMAIYFNQHISTKDLINWIISANDYLADYYLTKTDHYPAGSHFLGQFAWGFVSALLDAKPGAGRLKVLANELPALLSSTAYRETKEAIADICAAFLMSYQKVNHLPESITSFTGLLTHWMAIVSMYREYENS